MFRGKHLSAGLFLSHRLTNGTNVIVVLRCFEGNVDLTAARFSLAFLAGKGTRASVRPPSVVEAENSKLMNELSLPGSSKKD